MNTTEKILQNLMKVENYQGLSHINFKKHIRTYSTVDGQTYTNVPDNQHPNPGEINLRRAYRNPILGYFIQMIQNEFKFDITAQFEGFGGICFVLQNVPHSFKVFLNSKSNTIQTPHISLPSTILIKFQILRDLQKEKNALVEDAIACHLTTDTKTRDVVPRFYIGCTDTLVSGEQRCRIRMSAMEYLQGDILDHKLKKNNDIITLHLFKKIQKALFALWSARITHRDFHAGNIFITTDGNVRIIDFGVSTILSNVVEKELSTHGITNDNKKTIYQYHYITSGTNNKPNIKNRPSNVKFLKNLHNSFIKKDIAKMLNTR